MRKLIGSTVALIVLILAAPISPVLATSDLGHKTLTSGTLENIVIFARFSDQTEFDWNMKYFDDLYNSTAAGAPSMVNYYREISKGQLTIHTTFYPESYGGKVVSVQLPFATNPPTWPEDRVVAAVDAITGQVPEDLNIDLNNDGYVDNVTVILRGATADAVMNNLRPQFWSASINGLPVRSFNVYCEQYFLNNQGKVIINHEIAHTLGAPDLYQGSITGPFEPMGDVYDYTAPPPHFSYYMKWRYLGWAPEPEELPEGQMCELKPGEARKITTNALTGEYYIAEYRKKTGVFESSLPSQGLLIYKINPEEEGRWEFMLAYIPADYPYPLRYVNSAPFSKEVNRTQFNDFTNPKDMLQDGTLAGININNIGTCGDTIRFGNNVPAAIDRISIGGPASLYENSSTAFPVIATRADGSTSTVSATMKVNSVYASFSGSQMTASAVPSDQTARIDATYTENGMTFTASKSIRILKTPAIVSISALPSITAEGGKTCGKFVITATNLPLSKGGRPLTNLKVAYTFSGSADRKDYAVIAGRRPVFTKATDGTWYSVQILSIIAKKDKLVEDDETVICTLTPKPAYMIESGSATITITDLAR